MVTGKGRLMTHDELLAEIDRELRMSDYDTWHQGARALRAVVELHQPQDITLPDGSWGENCSVCDNGWTYPCRTIQAIEKEL